MRSAECGRTPFAIIREKAKFPFSLFNHQLLHPLMLGRPFEHIAPMRYIPKHDQWFSGCSYFKGSSAAVSFTGLLVSGLEKSDARSIFRPRGRIRR